MNTAARDFDADVRGLLLTRRSLMFISSHGEAPPAQVRAVELELAELGYALSSRLSARLLRCDPAELAHVRRSAVQTLAAHLGANRTHVPLFRSFPDDIPRDTTALWWRKLLSHYLQVDGQPCLFCRQSGTTHVLKPCEHVVCDRCFDGSSYSACPVCEHQVDRSAPFFTEAPVRASGQERVIFKILDLGSDPIAEARALFEALCARTQAMSPVDRDALLLLVTAHAPDILSWVPERIPVRENVAAVFGTLFTLRAPDEVLPHARRFMTTATDVLRFLAVFSGTDGSLMAEPRFHTFTVDSVPSYLSAQIAKWFAAQPRPKHQRQVTAVTKVKRFRMAKLSRPLRRALLSILEGLHVERLFEDMARHRSYWIWAGEFLHPHEYAERFPNVARSFAVLRAKAPDGTKAPAFHGWGSRVDRELRAHAVTELIATLIERPGELARRLDHVLRICETDPDRERVLSAFIEHLPNMATPVLLTLRSHLPRRNARAPVRMYWPKGRVALGATTEDSRPLLSADLIATAVRAITAELLARFARKAAFDMCVIDEALCDVVVPFNERTASRAAIALPRGSRLRVPSDKVIRLFMHWCERQGDGRSSDLDLSVALYDDGWRYLGTCSYYELHLRSQHGLIAQSAGDRQDAPFPDGASELVDIHLDVALASGARYAVMVVNNYAGRPFSQLERAFAGIMLRDDPGSVHFDPRTVELKFGVDGENGVFLPLVLDVRDSVLHWLDLQAKGRLEMNNVETSKRAIAKVAPAAMAYFASGTRASMLDLALLHAAARCRRVLIRGAGSRQLERVASESPLTFLARLEHERTATATSPELLEPALAFLLRGDIALRDGSAIYALFPEQLAPNLAAVDLL